MKRRSLTLLAAAVALAACADPAARITADEAAAGQDGVIGSGTRTEEEDPCRGYFGSGNTVPENCPGEETP